MQTLIDHLVNKYAPTGLIVYGSYSNGTNDGDSDFDALVIWDKPEKFHDTSVVNGVRLDVFGYPGEYLSGLEEPWEFLQIHDGIVVLDRDGAAESLKKQVNEYIVGFPKKTPEEKRELKAWCGKMLRRMERQDAEGRYRGHWLLTDSLSIYCDLRDQFYFGPKKTIASLKEKDPVGFGLFSSALEQPEGLKDWVRYIFKEFDRECD